MAHSSISKPEAATAPRCTRCGAGFRCGMTAGDATCWCYSLPHAFAVPSAGSGNASCLCPDCLQQLSDSRLSGRQPLASKP